MPKMHPLTIEGRIAAYDSAINGISRRLADPFFVKVDVRETRVELEWMRKKLIKERDAFIASKF